MERTYICEPAPRVDKRLFLLTILFTAVATLALWEFPIFVIGLTVVVVFVAGVYNLPELGVAVLVNGMYLVAFFWRSLPITYLVTPLVVALCTIGLAHYVLNQGLRWRFGVLPALVLLIGLMLLVGVLYSPLPSAGLIKAGKYLSMNLFVFFATILFTNDLNRLTNALRIIALLGFVTATVSVVFIACTGIGSITRFALPTQNPIWFARGLGMSLLAALFLLELSKRKMERLVYVSFVLVMFFLIYAAGSRGPFFALIISLFFYFLLLRRRSFNPLKGLVFLLLIFSSIRLMVAIAPQHIWHRMLKLFSGFDLTTFYRLRAFETAKDLFLDNPLKGVGTAGFGDFNMLSYPHNIFLELASELGTVGITAFAVLILYAAYLGVKLLRNKNASFPVPNLTRTFFTIFVFTLINAQVSGAVHGNFHLWFAIAGLWTLYRSRSECLKTK
jgi:O-antigen ligase